MCFLRLLKRRELYWTTVRWSSSHSFLKQITRTDCQALISELNWLFYRTKKSNLLYRNLFIFRPSDLDPVFLTRSDPDGYPSGSATLIMGIRGAIGPDYTDIVWMKINWSPGPLVSSLHGFSFRVARHWDLFSFHSSNALLTFVMHLFYIQRHTGSAVIPQQEKAWCRHAQPWTRNHLVTEPCPEWKNHLLNYISINSSIGIDLIVGKPLTGSIINAGEMYTFSKRNTRGIQGRLWGGGGRWLPLGYSVFK